MESGGGSEGGDASKPSSLEQPSNSDSVVEGVRFTNKDEEEEINRINQMNEADRQFLAVTPQSSNKGMMASVSDSQLDYSSTEAAALKAVPSDAVSNESGVDSEEPRK